MSEHRPAAEPETTEPAPYARTPSDPWPHSHLAPPVPAPAGRSRWSAVVRWLVPVAAGTAVLAVVAFLVAFLLPASGDGGDDPAALPFRPLVTVAEVAFSDRSSAVFAEVAADRAYAASVQEGGLEVIAVDLATGERLWTQHVSGAERWARVWALPDAVVLVGDAYSGLRPMIALDPETGEQRWRRQIRDDDQMWAFAETLVLTDQDAGQLLGMDYRDGPRPKWRVDLPEDGEAALRAVLTSADLAGPSTLGGGFPGPLHSDRLVMVSADRSASVVDVRDGTTVVAGTNVADPEDLLLAYGEWLIVAPAQEGYRVEAFSLADLDGGVRTLHRVADTTRVPVLLRPCGAAGVCLLDRVGRDDATTELVALNTAPDAGEQPRWRVEAPEAERILPVGDAVVVSGRDAGTRVFGADGAEGLAPAGAAVRLDEANLLVLSPPPGSFTEDLNLSGYPLVVAEGEPERVELGPVPGVIGQRCSWDSRHVACPSADGATISRLVRD